MDQTQLSDNYQKKLKDVEDAIEKTRIIFNQLQGQKILLESMINELNKEEK